MRRFIMTLMLLALPALALADTRVLDVFYNTTTQVLAGAAPSTATDGISIAGATGYQVIGVANSGQTITGGGATCYYRPVSTARWAPCGSSFDITWITGAREAFSGQREIAVPSGRIYFKSASTTVSGGSTIDIIIEVKK